MINQATSHGPAKPAEEARFSRHANLMGSLWMVASMAAFALEDTAVKLLAVTLPIGEIMALLGLGGALVFALASILRRERLFTQDILSPAMGIRALFEMTGRLFYALAIVLTPLSATSVILQATPLVVVAAAALLFGERVGWRRWSAIGVGLAGVLIIIGPGTDGFSLLSILAVIGMFGFAGRDLASRAAPSTISTSQLGFYGFLALAAAGLILQLWQGEAFRAPTSAALIYTVIAILIGVAAYACLMKAMRTGEISAVTPFRYSRLIFGVLLGVLWFGEPLTPAMLFGSVLIVLSGLFILGRSKQG
ncbi:DMT family transporter [Cohaesibacter sp. CAU 1516]|uniref:DMT family transporter n=1 Tax=Cohaesibacter sp. CAU 1516 TaxID=2576038 RepID=UPI001FEDCD5C|nr:DMT family transporter [Cohaesibacter sp. CAU 1516]